jgi:glycosyltransferase involved in cell wall biosynthesis
MHILFLSDNFPPETNAPASRLFEHAHHWVHLGHRVTVITCAPNFPEGKVLPGYRNRWYAVEKMEGIQVVRVKTYITANEGFLKRTLDYMSFMVAGFIAGLFQKDIHVIAATSPQFFSAVGAWLLAAVRRKPFVFELRDLWPAAIVTVGAMKDSLAIRLLEKLELFLYRQAAAVVALTQAFKTNLIQRGISGDKIVVVLNGVDLECYRPRPKDKELLAHFSLEGKFVVGYLGTHGMSHRLERVLEAAELLREHEAIVFLFAGSGVERNKLIEMAENRRLSNVRFIPHQPKNRMPQLWSLCDVALIHLKNTPVFATVIPSKLFEAMGMGLPILLALPEGEATEIVSQTGAGVVVPPEQPAKLVAAIIELCNHPAQLEVLRQASHNAAFQFSRTLQAEKMLNVFQAVIEGKGYCVGTLLDEKKPHHT